MTAQCETAMWVLAAAWSDKGLPMRSVMQDLGLRPVSEFWSPGFGLEEFPGHRLMQLAYRIRHALYVQRYAETTCPTMRQLVDDHLTPIRDWTEILLDPTILLADHVKVCELCQEVEGDEGFDLLRSPAFARQLLAVIDAEERKGGTIDQSPPDKAP